MCVYGCVIWGNRDVASPYLRHFLDGLLLFRQLHSSGNFGVTCSRYWFVNCCHFARLICLGWFDIVDLEWFLWTRFCSLTCPSQLRTTTSTIMITSSWQQHNLIHSWCLRLRNQSLSWYSLHQNHAHFLCHVTLHLGCHSFLHLPIWSHSWHLSRGHSRWSRILLQFPNQISYGHVVYLAGVARLLVCHVLVHWLGILEDQGNQGFATTNHCEEPQDENQLTRSPLFKICDDLILDTVFFFPVSFAFDFFWCWFADNPRSYFLVVVTSVCLVWFRSLCPPPSSLLWITLKFSEDSSMFTNCICLKYERFRSGCAYCEMCSSWFVEVIHIQVKHIEPCP